MKRLLPKLLFTLSFVIVAAFCISFLYGYRFDLEEKLIQKRGVLFINGRNDVLLTLDGEEKNVSLPYTNTNLQLGQHTVGLKKEGYLPYSTQIQVGETAAVLLSGYLAPDWNIIPTTTYTPTDDIQYSITPAGQLIEYFSAQGKLFMYTAPANIRQKTPNDFITLSPNPERGKLTKITPLNNALFLATFEKEDLIIEFSTQTQIPLVHTDAEELFVEKNRIFSWNPTAGLLSLYDEATGGKTQQVWANLTTRKVLTQQGIPTSVFYSTAQERYLSIQESLLGQIDLTVSQLSPEITSRLLIRNTAYNLTSTGLLMKDTVPVLQDITQIFGLQGIHYALGNNGNAYILSTSDTAFATRFTTAVQKIFSTYNSDYLYFSEGNTISYCERKELMYCRAVLEASDATDFAVNTEQTVLFVSHTNGTISAYFSATSDD